ncbi:MAG: hypothetical protein WEA56_10315 [Balneolaceae bacterium]
MSRIGLLVLLSLVLSSCTTGRWTVADERATDMNEAPEVIHQEDVLLVEQFPTVENPVIAFSPYTVSRKEYTQRIKVERSIQKYRPRGIFLATTLAGAAFSFLAANTDAVMPSASVSQKVAMNFAGGLLGVLSFINLEPTGEPIQTGESRLMRKSGSIVIRDTTKTASLLNISSAEVTVRFNEEIIFNQPEAQLSQDRLEINLGAFAGDLNQPLNEDSEISIELVYGDFSTGVNVPIRDFLSKYVKVTAPVAVLRNVPEFNDNNIITEIGEGSQLRFIEEEGDWYTVQYDELTVHMQKNTGQIEWISTFDSGPALLVEFAEIPFGEVDVERMIPILKIPDIRDRGIIITNFRNNQIGNRQYMERDHRLFRQYIETALQVHENRFSLFDNQHPDDWAETLSSIPQMYEEGSLFVYLSGFASVRNGEITLSYKDEDGASTHTPLSTVFESLKNAQPQELYLFVDLQYQNEEQQFENGSASNGNRTILEETAGVILRELPNSVIVFSSLPNQQSALYTGQAAEENKRHHIFNYYWAEALQQRKTRISDLIQHLQNNVDYTSRRLHDRPQEIRVFGNTSLNLAE